VGTGAWQGPGSVTTETTAVVVLFNPRAERWKEHFAYRGALIEGITSTGRANELNQPLRVDAILWNWARPCA
jgi:hypothetical protein